MTWRIGFTIIAWVVIISFILMISTNDLAILLLGEIRYWSLSEFKGLKSVNTHKYHNFNLLLASCDNKSNNGTVIIMK